MSFADGLTGRREYTYKTYKSTERDCNTAIINILRVHTPSGVRATVKMDKRQIFVRFLGARAAGVSIETIRAAGVRLPQKIVRLGVYTLLLLLLLLYQNAQKAFRHILGGDIRDKYNIVVVLRRITGGRVLYGGRAGTFDEETERRSERASEGAERPATFVRATV